MSIKSAWTIHVYKDIQIQLSDIHVLINSCTKSSKHATVTAKKKKCLYIAFMCGYQASLGCVCL